LASANGDGRLQTNRDIAKGVQSEHNEAEPSERGFSRTPIKFRRKSLFNFVQQGCFWKRKCCEIHLAMLTAFDTTTPHCLQ